MTNRRVQLLYSPDCPNWPATRELIDQVGRELAIDLDLELVEVADERSARRNRFLGSPTVRVDGRDLEPGAAERDDYALACRVYPTEQGPSGRPDPGWLRDALRRSSSSGRARRLHVLSSEEQRVYRTLLEQFAAGTPPSAADLDGAAAAAGVDAAELRTTLARHDLVHCANDGTPLVAYPFSATPRGHRVLVGGRATVEAMCAIDALGIAGMLDLPTQISSHDPITGTPIRIHVQPSGDATWRPAHAVVLSTPPRCDGPSYQTCCSTLNFFESTESARRYLVDDPHTGGHPISIPEAVGEGSTTFGDLLTTLAR